MSRKGESVPSAGIFLGSGPVEGAMWQTGIVEERPVDQRTENEEGGEHRGQKRREQATQYPVGCVVALDIIPRAVGSLCCVWSLSAGVSAGVRS